MDFKEREISKEVFRAIYIALGAIAEIIAIAIIFSLKISIAFIILVFTIAMIIYLFDFFRESKKLISDRLHETFSTTQKLFFYAVLLILLIAFFYIITRYGTFLSIIFSILLIAAGLLYDPYLKNITKYIVGFKDIYVALCWNTLVILFFLFHRYPLSSSVIFILFFVFSRDLVNTIFCDFKDIATDKINGLNTIAIKLGIKNTTIILQLLNLLSIILLLIGLSTNLLPIFAYALFLPVIITVVFITFAYKEKTYSPYFVDTEYFTWLVSVISVIIAKAII